jgi:Protein of unknown function (DUF4232)
MRRMALLAVMAGCVVAMASGCAAEAVKASGPPAAPRAAQTRVPVRTPGQAPAAVPWVARIAPAPTTPAPVALPTATARFAPCTAAHLSGHAGDLSEGAGGRSADLVVTNVGSAPCSITGGPSGADGILTDGSRQALVFAASQAGAFGLSGPPVNLRPGQSAMAVISGGDGPGMCAGSRGYDLSAVLLGIGTTGWVRVPFPGKGSMWAGEGPLVLYSCAPAAPFVSGFGVPIPSDAPPPSPLDVLTITRSMPASLAPGSMADYTVTLDNPTARAVALDPCPAYSQFIVPAHGKPLLPGSYYYLNCAAAPRIPAHGAVTFAMRIQVPIGSGEAKYGWLIPGTTLQTGGVTTLG